MRLVLILAFLTFVALPAFAEDGVMVDPMDRGPVVGTPIPSNLVSVDQDGTARSFENLTGPKGLVLVFFRSAKWCPFCKQQLMDIAVGAEEITSRGYNLAVLSYDSLNVIKRYVSEHEPGFIMLSDRKSEVIDAFGIRNEKYGALHFANGVPHPMIFVIGHDKVIQAKLAEDGYKTRPPVNAVTEAIDALPTHGE